MWSVNAELSVGNINNEMLDSQLIQPQQREILIDKCFPLEIKLSYKMFVYMFNMISLFFCFSASLKIYFEMTNIVKFPDISVSTNN